MKYAIPMALAAAIACGTTVGAAQAASERGRPAVIHFANHGGIYDYKPVNDQLLYVQARDRSWYRVELLAPCSGLNFALGIGFEPEPNGDFTRFSHVRVNGERCPVASMVAINGPPPRSAN